MLFVCQSCNFFSLFDLDLIHIFSAQFDRIAHLRLSQGANSKAGQRANDEEPGVGGHHCTQHPEVQYPHSAEQHDLQQMVTIALLTSYLLATWKGMPG